MMLKYGTPEKPIFIDTAQLQLHGVLQLLSAVDETDAEHLLNGSAE